MGVLGGGVTHPRLAPRSKKYHDKARGAGAPALLKMPLILLQNPKVCGNLVGPAFECANEKYLMCLLSTSFRGRTWLS